MMIATIKIIVISGGLATPTLSVEAFASLECDDSRCRLSSICVCVEGTHAFGAEFATYIVVNAERVV